MFDSIGLQKVGNLNINLRSIYVKCLKIQIKLLEKLHNFKKCTGPLKNFIDLCSTPDQHKFFNETISLWDHFYWGDSCSIKLHVHYVVIATTSISNFPSISLKRHRILQDVNLSTPSYTLITK